MSASKIKGTKPGATHKTGPGRLGPAEFARWYRDQTLSAWDSVAASDLAKLARAVARAGTIYVAGNGGSAASASHIACDLAKTAGAGLKVVSLSENMAHLTAIANDKSFDDVFADQLAPLVKRGDLVLLVSGSGNSPNLLKAAAVARKKGAVTAALLGFDGGRLKKAVSIPLWVKSDQYGVIEDVHMSICHILAFWLKQRR
jgi:phosphoheptose isomerase